MDNIERKKGALKISGSKQALTEEQIREIIREEVRKEVSRNLSVSLFSASGLMELCLNYGRDRISTGRCSIEDYR